MVLVGEPNEKTRSPVLRSHTSEDHHPPGMGLEQSGVTATPRIVPFGYEIVRTISPVATSHTRAARSPPPVATSLSSGLKHAAPTEATCPASVLDSPLSRFQ